MHAQHTGGTCHCYTAASAPTCCIQDDVLYECLELRLNQGQATRQALQHRWQLQLWQHVDAVVICSCQQTTAAAAAAAAAAQE
jgi:hypothetical protein